MLFSGWFNWRLLICKRFAMRASAAFKAGKIPLEAEFQGKHVVISMDGGRLRI